MQKSRIRKNGKVIIGFVLYIKYEWKKVTLMTLSVTKVRYDCYIRKVISGNDFTLYSNDPFFIFSFHIKSKVL